MTAAAAVDIGACPQCGSVDIELDAVQALSYCQDCGCVLSSVTLDSHNAVGDTGVFVTHLDDGRAAGAFGLRQGAVGGHGYFKKSQARVQQQLKQLAGRLSIPGAVQKDAEGLLEQLLPKMYGHNKLAADRLAAVALYIAARLAMLPLTVVDVASAVKLPAHHFGRLFRAAAAHLNIALPTTPPAVFLQSAVQQLGVEAAQQAAWTEEAALVDQWLEAQDLPGTPMLRIAAALVLTLESKGTKKSKAVAKALNVNSKHLDARVLASKSALVAAAQHLPWGPKSSEKNIVHHLLSTVKWSTRPNSPLPATKQRCDT